MTTEPTNPEAAPEILPCPFCGNPEPIESTIGINTCILCCGIELPLGRWNRRPPAESAASARDAESGQPDIILSEYYRMGRELRVTQDALTAAKARIAAAEERAQKAEAEVASLQRRLNALPADWLEDSSLETWFPMTAAELAELRARLSESEQSRELTCQAGHILADQIRTLKSDIEGFRKWQRETEIERDAARASEQRLRSDLESARKWITRYVPESFADHACAQCRPNSEILIEGFVCEFHKALAATPAEPAAPATAAGGEDAK
jgi:hypothetical protein